MKRHLFCAALLIAATTSIQAASITIGSDDSGNCYPFSCGPSDNVTRYQQQYRAGAFGTSSPISINSLTFFRDSGTLGNTATFDVYLTTSPLAFGSLSTNLNLNVGLDRVLFATVTFGPTMPATFTVTGAAPFVYDPGAGTLLMDVVVSSVSSTANSYASFFNADYNGTNTLRTYSSASSAANVTGALVTQFTYDAGPVVPEPSSYALIGGGLAALIAYRRKAARK